MFTKTVSSYLSSPNDLYMLSFGQLNGKTAVAIKNIDSSIKNSISFLFIYGIKF